MNKFKEHITQTKKQTNKNTNKQTNKQKRILIVFSVAEWLGSRTCNREVPSL